MLMAGYDDEQERNFATRSDREFPDLRKVRRTPRNAAPYDHWFWVEEPELEYRSREEAIQVGSRGKN